MHATQLASSLPAIAEDGRARVGRAAGHVDLGGLGRRAQRELHLPGRPARPDRRSPALILLAALVAVVAVAVVGRGVQRRRAPEPVLWQRTDSAARAADEAVAAGDDEADAAVAGTP